MKKKSGIALISVFLIISLFLSGAALADVEGSLINVGFVNQDPDPAYAGDISEIRISVENLGTASSEDFFVEILEAYPFQKIYGEELVKEIGSISTGTAGDSRSIVKFKVRIDKDATAGSYNLQVLRYGAGKRNPEIKTMFPISIESRESAEIIYIDQIELIPGEITPLKFTINNVGSAPLRELSFQWENEDDLILPVGSDNTKYIKYLDAGESVEVNFNVMASAIADPDLYKLDLTLKYKESSGGEDKEIATKAGIYVGGATDFDVAYSGVTSGEYSFSIANIGSVSASSVTVSIPEQQGWTVTGSRSVIIGNLNKGDYTIAGFSLQSASKRNFTDIERPSQQGSQNLQGASFQRPSSTNSIKMDITYTDSRGNRETITKEVEMPSSSASSTDTTTAYDSSQRNFRQQADPLQLLWTRGWWILLIAIAFFGIWGVRRRFKKGRLVNPDYTYKMALKDFFKKKKKNPIK